MGGIYGSGSEVKLGPCTSLLRIVLHYMIINTVYMRQYTLYLELPTRSHLFLMYLLILIDVLLHAQQ